MDYVFYFLICAALFAGIDLIWLGKVAKKFYRDQMGDLFVKKVVAGPAIAFYCLYIIGLLFFCLRPALANDSLLTAIGYGSLFGLIAYATYDLTNWATTQNWPPKLAVIDMLWGGVLSGTSISLTFLLVHNWN